MHIAMFNWFTSNFISEWVVLCAQLVDIFDKCGLQVLVSEVNQPPASSDDDSGDSYEGNGPVCHR